MTEPSDPPDPESEVPGDATSEAWSDLTDDLLGLTDKLRTTYRRCSEASGPSEDEVREAFRTIAGAWSQIAGSVGTAIQDPDVKSHLKSAASSLVTAIGASLAELKSKPPPPGTDVSVVSAEPDGEVRP